MLSNLRHKFVILLKRAFYGSRGEPYPVNGRTLRYIAGTRPVRLHYKNSPNANVRFDALQVELLLRGLKAGDTAIDLGAHCGQYCLIMAELCGPTGNVVAFEPDPHARELLEKNLALNPEVKKPTIEAIAISDADGEAILHSRGGNSQSSLARSAVVFSGEQKSEEFRGEGDANKNRIFAEAFGRDPDFFRFYRSMQAYETGLKQGDTRLILNPNSDFFRYFSDPSGKKQTN